jgi:hypothetical protein
MPVTAGRPGAEPHPDGQDGALRQGGWREGRPPSSHEQIVEEDEEEEEERAPPPVPARRDDVAQRWEGLAGIMPRPQAGQCQ